MSGVCMIRSIARAGGNCHLGDAGVRHDVLVTTPRVLVTRGSRCWALARGTQDASPMGHRAPHESVAGSRAALPAHPPILLKPRQHILSISAELTDLIPRWL